MRIAFAFPNSQLPWWLLGIAVVIGILVLTLRSLERRREERIRAFVEGGLASRLLIGYSAAVRRPLSWLLLSGFLMALLALAQPKWGRLWEEVRKTSRDILIVLDTSESMNAENPDPSRMERARQEIEALLERSPGDRIGLIAFSGGAELQCPLTLDHGYFRAVLNAVDTDTISKEGTRIDLALDEAITVFEDVDEAEQSFSRDSRAVILISDGEQVSGDAIAAADRLAEYARVFVIGIGDPNGVAVQMPDWMLRSPHRGGGSGAARQQHLSKLDEDTLMRIANAGGGSYVRSRSDMQDSDHLANQLRELSARTVDSEVRERLVNRYQLPLLVALHCFIAEGVWLAFLPWLRQWRTRRAVEAAEVEHA